MLQIDPALAGLEFGARLDARNGIEVPVLGVIQQLAKAMAGEQKAFVIRDFLEARPGEHCAASTPFQHALEVGVEHQQVGLHRRLAPMALHATGAELFFFSLI